MRVSAIAVGGYLRQVARLLLAVLMGTPRWKRSAASVLGRGAGIAMRLEAGSSSMTNTAPGDRDGVDRNETFHGDEERWQPRSEDASAIPYDRVEPPADRPYEEYTYVQRRAVLLRRIERVGHPRALNQTQRELAAEFDVGRASIHRDMKALARFMADNVDRDHVVIMDAVFRGAILDLVKEGNLARAAEIGREWFDWLADLGAIDRVADKVDFDATQKDRDSDTYRVIGDNEAIED